MKYKTKHSNITKEMLESVITESSSMAHAADKLNLAFSTFKRHVLKHGIEWKTNQSGKGKFKPQKKLEDVFLGKEHLVTSALRLRLIREGYKEDKCEECGISEWNGKPISLELDHVSGIRTDNSLENLKILCPNCHSQTSTFRGRNIKL
jgi:5-methylcytosine-specific restriction endonuclease McrA